MFSLYSLFLLVAELSQLLVVGQHPVGIADLVWHGFADFHDRDALLLGLLDEGLDRVGAGLGVVDEEGDLLFLDGFIHLGDHGRARVGFLFSSFFKVLVADLEAGPL